MSTEIREEQELMMLLNKKTADERLAAFIMNLSSRFKRRNLSATQFQLSMSRGDIANYLGLAVETISRLLTRFQEKGLIDFQNRFLTITNITELSILAGTSCHD